MSPCGGIYLYPSEWDFDLTDPDFACMQCGNPIPDEQDRLLVYEWDGYIHRRCLGPYLCGEEGKVVVFAAGTGNPFFTTDTAAALRGAEIGAEMVLKATKVDGVYTADPNKDPKATRYSELSFDEAMGRNLGIMDATAFALCRDQKLPIKVFSIFKNGALKRVVMGEDEGTLVHV